jgi:S1-C subfamily serine protease
MKLTLSILLITVVIVGPWSFAQSPKTFELNTTLMESTFRIQGQSARGPGLGTGFLLGRLLPSTPGQSRAVIVTAAHVLTEMTGNSVTLVMRRKQADSSWQEVPVEVPIRLRGHPLWVQHPKADVAVMYLPTVPDELRRAAIVPTDLLATDQLLAQFEIHPGDELNVLGYPLGFSHTGGFAVLRSGKIASYPLIPTKDNPYFLLDFRVFRGNSGGPVYLVQSNRTYGGAIHMGTVNIVMGLVSEEISATEQLQGLYENRVETHPLGLAKVVPASYIVETINLLPPAE